MINLMEIVDMREIGKNWDNIVRQVLDFVKEINEYFIGEYAVLIDKDFNVYIEKLPSPSQYYWNKELPYIEIGKIIGDGLDGITIDIEYGDYSYYENGYFNLPYSEGD